MHENFKTYITVHLVMFFSSIFPDLESTEATLRNGIGNASTPERERKIERERERVLVEH